MPKEEEEKSHIPTRISFVFLIVFILFSVLIFRVAYIQLIEGKDYLIISEVNSTKTIPISAPRGWILDKNGEVLVDNKPVYTVTFQEDQRLNINKREVAQRLIKFLKDREVDEWIKLNNREQLIKELKRYGRKQEDLNTLQSDALGELLKVDKLFYAMITGYRYMPKTLKVGVTHEEMFYISEHRSELPGIDIVVEATRHYKRGAFASHFLGYTKPIDPRTQALYEALGYKNDDKIGVQGLERFYEAQLHGKQGKVEAKINSLGKIIETRTIEEPIRGNDLILTIDANFQQKVETILENSLQELRTRERNPLPDVDEAIAVVMNPMTGAILAMAAYPDYDLNYQNSPDFSKLYNTYIRGRENNKAIRGAFPAASTIKPLGVMMALQKKTIGPQTTIFDPGYFQVGNVKKKNWRKSGHGRVYPERVIQVSNNTYMYYIAMQIAKWPSSKIAYRQAFDEIDYFYSQFGLGVKTGVDLQEELTGWRTSTKYLGNVADALIGQYNAYTPLQITQYVSTIANGGYRMRPYLVQQIRKASQGSDERANILFNREPEVLNRVDIDQEWIALAQRGMKKVTERGGTAYNTFKSLPIEIAAKTGTAETGIEGMNNSVIIAYAPYNKPEIALTVVVPKGGGGSDASGMIAKKIFSEYFNIKIEEQEEKNKKTP